MDCLIDIIGVTKDESDCMTQGLSSEEIAQLKVSKSGLYLDDLPGGITVRGLQYVDPMHNLAMMSADAIRNAQKATEDDLRIALSNKYQGAKKNYIGNIGRMSYAQTLQVQKRFAGVWIKANAVSDAVLTIERMFIILNYSGNVGVAIFRRPIGTAVLELVTNFTIMSVPNAFSQATTGIPVTLPLTMNGRPLEYFIGYDRQAIGNALPKDTKVDGSGCNNCGNKTTLSDYVTATGTEFDDINNPINRTNDGYSRGIVLDVVLKCESEKLVCREYDQNEAISVAMSRAIWFKAGELLIEDVLKQPEINRYTTMDKERLWGKRNHFRAEYETRINYMANSIDVTDSNCYVCRENSNTPFFAGILS